MRDHLVELRRASSDDPEPDHRLAHRSTAVLLDRIGGAGDPLATGRFDRFVAVAAGRLRVPGGAVSTGVMANMLAVMTFAHDRDLVTTSRLIREYGAAEVARLQSDVDGLLGSGHGLPIATAYVRRLTSGQRVAADLQAAGLDARAAGEVADDLRRSAFLLVMEDVETTLPGRRLESPEEASRIWDDEGIEVWRGQLAVVAAEPWAPYARELSGLFAAADRPVPARGVQVAVDVLRARTERSERDDVGREIRRLVAVSNLSQHEFAARIGTSASRLSTYVNAKVTPSATLMLRIRQASDLARNRG